MYFIDDQKRLGMRTGMTHHKRLIVVRWEGTGYLRLDIYHPIIMIEK